MTTAHEEFVEQLKNTILAQPFPPRYNPRKWKKKRFNCYAYVMQACMNLSGHDIWPGFISKGDQNNYTDTKECVVASFKEDFEVLGLNVFPTTLKEKIEKNAYKIVVYVNEGEDFHFARQDKDGQWSEKDGWTGKIRKVSEENIDEFEEGYEFVGVFKVSKK